MLARYAPECGIRCIAQGAVGVGRGVSPKAHFPSLTSP